MADIQLVIEIPEEEYQNILHTGKASFCTVNAIEAGTPLPKGHGRLIDADDLIQELSVVSSRPIKSQLYIFRDAPTIIEADKAESEG